jgi:hypothetical protein
MASTYSTNLKIQLMTTGENTGTWGSVTNVNLGTALEEAIIGSTSVAFNGADVTLTLTNSNASQTARNLRLVLTGTSGGARQLVVPALEKTFIIKNELSDTCTVLVSGQTGVAVPAGKTMWLYNDGTDVKDVTTHLSSLTLASALPVASGGTGINAAGTAGNALVSNGSVWASQSVFSSGMILLWSGSVGSIPSGWVLCDGANSTPDLRDKFIVGAGSTYAVGATGGSPNAIVVTHDHTFSGTTAANGAHQHFVSGGTYAGAKLGTLEANPNGTLKVGDSLSGNQNQYQLQATSSAATAGLTSTASTHDHTYSGTTASAGSSGTNANLPPYYALAYIMKT